MSEARRHLVVGAFQFAGSGDPMRNAAALERGMKQAAGRGVRLLATQECALSGYPGVDVESTATMDRTAQAQAARRVAELARRYRMYVVLGMTTFVRGAARNSVCLVGPDGRFRPPYDKRALYGHEGDFFAPGESSGGIHMVDGIRVGLRICYEFRFPEYFRELFRRRVQLAVVSFSMGGPPASKFPVARAHLISRAAENSMYVLSANSTSRAQTAPTCLIDPDGRILASAPRNRETLITGIVEIAPPKPGRRAIVAHSGQLCGHRGRSRMV
jgi:omega-amidase